MITSDIFSDMDEILGSVVQSGLKRIRAWCAAELVAGRLVGRVGGGRDRCGIAGGL